MAISLLGCKSLNQNIKPEKLASYNPGYYTLEYFKCKDPMIGDSVWLSVEVKDLREMKVLPQSTLRVVGLDRRLANGKINIKFHSGVISEQYDMISLGHTSVKTMPIISKPKDSIVLNFVLGEERAILVNTVLTHDNSN